VDSIKKDGERMGKKGARREKEVKKMFCHCGVFAFVFI